MKLFVIFFICFIGHVSSAVVNKPNLEQLAVKLGCNTLVSLLQAAGLNETIAESGPYTIFAPSDAAFARVPASVIQSLQSDTKLLQTVLKYHVVSGSILSSDLINDFQIPTLDMYKKIRVNLYQNDTIVTITGKRVTLADQYASNGVIHIIDDVLYPIPDKSLLEYAASQPSLTQLVYNVIRSDLQADLAKGPFTVFAPSDASFFGLPTGYLNEIFLDKTRSQELIKYHIVPGTVYSAGLKDGMMVTTTEGNKVAVHINSGGVMINNVTVTQADISITNGVIHLVSGVLIPPELTNISI